MNGLIFALKPWYERPLKVHGNSVSVYSLLLDGSLFALRRGIDDHSESMALKERKSDFPSGEDIVWYPCVELHVHCDGIHGSNPRRN